MKRLKLSQADKPIRSVNWGGRTTRMFYNRRIIRKAGVLVVMLPGL